VRVHEGAKKGKRRKRRGGALYKYPKNLGVKKEKVKTKILASILVIFAVVLSTGAAYAASPFEGADSSVESSMPRSFVLESSIGDKWSLDPAFGCVLYGKAKVGANIFPAYGFIFGNEMVLWQDPDGIATDSVAFTGAWDFGTMKWNGFGVNYPDGTVVPVEMWVAKSGFDEEIETEENPLIAQSGAAASDIQDVGISPAGATPGGKVKIEQNPQSPFGDLSDHRGTSHYKDSNGYSWHLDEAFGCIWYGSVVVGGEPYPAYGFRFKKKPGLSEAFYWCNGKYGSEEWSYVYTGKWDEIESVYFGTWVSNPYGGSGTVSMWPYFPDS